MFLHRIYYWLLKQSLFMLAALCAGQNEEAVFFGEKPYSKSLFCKYRININFYQNTPDPSTCSFHCLWSFLSYCSSCILFFWPMCLISFSRLIAGILTLSLCFFYLLWGILCSALPFCLIVFVFLTHKTENVDQWRTGSEATGLEHIASGYSERPHPSPFRKYEQSLQTLKPIRWSSSESVLFSTCSTSPVLMHFINNFEVTCQFC